MQEHLEDVSSVPPLSSVSVLVGQAIKSGLIPGAIVAVGWNGRLIFNEAFGNRSFESDSSPLRKEMAFDLGGLSALMVTSTLCMRLIEDGRLRLEDRVSRYLHGFGVHGKAGITIEHLLSHTSGLPRSLPLYEEVFKAESGARPGIMNTRGARELIVNSVFRLPIRGVPGDRYEFSEIGFLVLGLVLEEIAGCSLDKAAIKYVFSPLRLRSSSFVELSSLKRGTIQAVEEAIVPSGYCRHRNRSLCGEVHDPNAWVMGGISGFSGVFSCLNDLHNFAVHMIAAYSDLSDFLKADTVRRFWGAEEGRPLALGWESPNGDNGMLHSKLSQQAVGHCGYNGCSLWIEPEKALDICILASCPQSRAEGRELQRFRSAIHESILKALSN